MAPLTGDNFHNPTLTGPRSTHNIPSGGLYSAYSSVHIAAPPQTVYDALLNVGDYPNWNTFVYDVTITKNPNPHVVRRDGSHKRMNGGTCMVFHSQITAEPMYRTTSREVVTLVEPLKIAKDGHTSPCVTRVRWSLDNAALATPGFLLKGERVNEIEETHDGGTTYRTWQTFSGPVAKILRKKYEAPLRDRLQDWTGDLKGWCEMKAREGEVEEDGDVAQGVKKAQTGMSTASDGRKFKEKKGIM